jgi:hypothetical protein
MFNKKTVVVIGAGASKEAGLPTGTELKATIATLLDIQLESGHRVRRGDALIFEALIARASSDPALKAKVGSLLAAARQISEAMPYAISIDNFLDAHRENEKIELCGKLAIVRSILDAERKSPLYVDTRQSNAVMDADSLGATWFASFFQLLTEYSSVGELPQRLEPLSLIIFNYDRCVEHFLFHTLQTYYGIGAERAEELVSSIEIHHPYGIVGRLPWQRGDAPSIPFGGEPQPNELLGLASNIKTFTESKDPQHGDVASIRERIANAEIVVFLGFSFHKFNMALLRDPEDPASPSPVRVYATTKGISSQDCEIVAGDLQKVLGVQVNLNLTLGNQLSCYQLFQEHWRALALS